MISEISLKESREALARRRMGRLGCCFNDSPYVVPVNYFLEGDFIYIHSLPGQKIDIMRGNPRACLQVDEIESDYNWLSVLVFGRYEEITDLQEREEKLAALFRHLPHLTPVESRSLSGQDQTILFRIQIEHLSGVSERWG
jgi:uncharacterized protein